MNGRLCPIESAERWQASGGDVTRADAVIVSDVGEALHAIQLATAGWHATGGMERVSVFGPCARYGEAGN